jgi:hypothetical protein
MTTEAMQQIKIKLESLKKEFDILEKDSWENLPRIKEIVDKDLAEIEKEFRSSENSSEFFNLVMVMKKQVVYACVAIADGSYAKMQPYLP